MNKFVILKINFDEKLGRNQDIFVLLKNGQLFSAESVYEAEEKFNDLFSERLLIGKILYEDKKTKYYIAATNSFAEEKAPTLPDGWDFISLKELNSSLCSDYEIIKKITEKLGYKVK